MTQLVLLSNKNVRLRATKVGLARYEYTGEVVGAGSAQLFVDGKPGYVVALEPNTSGVIHYMCILSQVTTLTGVFTGNNYQELLARYSVSSSGVVTLSVGASTYGTLATPEVPVSNAPNGRLTAANVTLTAVNQSATVTYPYVRVDVIGGAQTNNWLVTADAWTLPSKGV